MSVLPQLLGLVRGIKKRANMKSEEKRKKLHHGSEPDWVGQEKETLVPLCWR